MVFAEFRRLFALDQNSWKKPVKEKHTEIHWLTSSQTSRTRNMAFSVAAERRFFTSSLTPRMETVVTDSLDV